MNESNTLYGWEQTKSIWSNKHYRFFYRILGGAVLVGLGVLIGASLFAEKQLDYLMSLFTNVLSIFVTVFVLDELARRRDHFQERDRLIREMNNKDSGIVMRAVDELRANGWLEDGSLSNARMGDANFRGVNLKRANLSGVRFLSDKQLAQAQRLWKAIMPDGRRYNGRFNLPADIARAREQGINPDDPHQMAKDYQVSVDDYLEGQKWFADNANWLKKIQTEIVPTKTATTPNTYMGEKPSE